MLCKIVTKIKLLLRIKLSFNLPKKNNILLYDEVHASILREIIKKDFNILELRENKKIYFWIYLKQIFFFDFSFFTYSRNFIKFTSPKVIITFNDARIGFYKLKKEFKNIYFISIINGHRDKAWFKKNKKFEKEGLKCDYSFVLNKHFISKYQRIVKSKYFVFGHFRNNLVKIGKTKFHKEFLLVSQVHTSVKTGTNVFMQNFYKKLLNSINQFLIKKNKKIHILLRRSKENLMQDQEINFYKKILKSNCIFHQSIDWKKKYKLMDKFENIIFTHSTMGYEAIGRKKKVAIFTPNKLHNEDNHFGWPAPYKKKYNFFSTRNFSSMEIERVLRNLYNCSESEWNKKYYKVIQDQSHFDQNNKSLKNLILKLTKTKY